MASYHFVVYGNPKALKRHRTATVGNTKIRYDPSAGDKKDFVAAIQDNVPKFLITGGVQLSIYAYFPRPKSHFRTGKFVGELKKDAPTIHLNNPEDSNILKFVEDALNGVFWKDDRQVFHSEVWKLYDHEKPRVEVFVNTV